MSSSVLQMAERTSWQAIASIGRELVHPPSGGSGHNPWKWDDHRLFPLGLSIRPQQ